MEENNIKTYWNLRAEGFSLSNQAQLQSDITGDWNAILQQYAPRKDKLKCLDIGCGPGFLAILLAKMGHNVSAIDYTENMLRHAEKNAKKDGLEIDFMKMDAQNLDFEGNYFDYIVSRNLTWNLEFPHQAYSEWLRVLKPSGRLLIFDGNHYLHCYNKLYQQYRNSNAYVDSHNKEHLKGIDTNRMERIAMNLPLSKVERPGWDLRFFDKAGEKKVMYEVESSSFTDNNGEEQSVINNFYICVQKRDKDQENV
ncbi:class I SAM-dependent methyltransferase [Salicibibacter kimchii]|uniref:Class I SAM-dependent methyltransferase n=1 Tax=Salicibibacter kimchii TaxID=2099786 RepID=A0A345C0K7_9BACI|nr:class I SAM-dependent methyltransferase [Salicibibacter kimchii]AXF56738.1 class I SAM-dependent methyltransferase [Salicibibacter kimchii]